MKARNWKYLVGLVIAGIVVNALWSWWRHYPFSWGQELFFLLVFMYGGVLGTSFFDRGRSGEAPLRVEPAGPGVARVYVNDVEVGALPEEQYQQIVAEARASKWLYARQALNVIASMGRFAADVVRTIPWVWFGSVALAAICAPDALTDAFTQLAQSRPDQVTQTIREYLGLSALFCFVTCSVTAFLSERWYGFFSPFDRQIAQRLRELLEVPAEGNVRVTVSQTFQGAAR